MASQRPLKSRQVVQTDFSLADSKFDLSTVLPMPFRAFGAELSFESFARDGNLKTSGRAGSFPVRHPVLGPSPDTVFARFANLYRGHRIIHRLPQAVGEQIRRAHDLNELRVEFPSSMFSERLSFDQNRIGRLNGGNAWKE